MLIFKRKRFIITSIIIVVTIFFVIIGIFLFSYFNNKTQNEEKPFSKNLKLYSDCFEMTTRPCSSQEGEAGVVNDVSTQSASQVDTFMEGMIRKMLWTLATDENKFTISSSSDLAYYTNATHYEVPDYSNPRKGAYLSAGTGGSVLHIQTYTYYDKIRPVDYYFQVSVTPGDYVVELFTQNGQLYERIVTVSRTISGYYQCELELTNSFTLDVSSFKPFCQFEGIFNGNGNTITCSGQRTISSSNDYYDTDSSGMFFAYNYSSGTIKDTKFSNISLFMDSGSVQYVGGIVGYNAGTVKSCWVAGCTFKSNRYKTNCTVAPLAGLNKGSVNNCMVTGTYTIAGKGGNAFSNADGLKACYFVTYRNPDKDKDKSSTVSNQASYCTFNATVSKSHSKEDYKEHLIPPSSWDDIPSTCYTGTSGSFAVLSKSVKGGSESYAGNPWYYCTSYSSWPMLRPFMSWKYVTFTAGNHGKVSTQWDSSSKTSTGIYVPSSASYSSFGAQTSATIYQQKITVTPDTGYEVESWDLSGNTYTIKYKELTYTVYFLNNTSVSIKLGTNTRLGANYTVSYNTSISVVATEYSSGKYKQVVISFIDSSNTERSVTYYIDKDNASSKYYIEKYEFTTAAASKDLSTESNRKILESGKIGVTAQLKTYDITIN